MSDPIHYRQYRDFFILADASGYLVFMREGQHIATLPTEREAKAWITQRYYPEATAGGEGI